MILVIGATGTTGRELIKALSAAGIPARAMTRSPERASGLRLPGIEVAAGDLSDTASLEKPFRGVNKVFLLSSGSQNQVREHGNAIAAAKHVGAKQIVKLSAFAVKADSPSMIFRWHAETDRELAGSGLSWTILRPNFFMQNVAFFAETIKSQNAFYAPLAQGKASLVDVRDIAAVALKILSEGSHSGEILEITGPKALSGEDMAAGISAVLGHRISYVNVPPEAAVQAMIQAGTPEWAAGDVVKIYGMWAAGKMGKITDAVEKVTGKKARSFDTFLRDHKNLL